MEEIPIPAAPISRKRSYSCSDPDSDSEDDSHLSKRSHLSDTSEIESTPSTSIRKSRVVQKRPVDRISAAAHRLSAAGWRISGSVGAVNFLAQHCEETNQFAYNFGYTLDEGDSSGTDSESEEEVLVRRSTEDAGRFEEIVEEEIIPVPVGEFFFICFWDWIGTDLVLVVETPVKPVKKVVVKKLIKKAIKKVEVIPEIG